MQAQTPTPASTPTLAPPSGNVAERANANLLPNQTHEGLKNQPQQASSGSLSSQAQQTAVMRKPTPGSTSTQPSTSRITTSTGTRTTSVGRSRSSRAAKGPKTKWWAVLIAAAAAIGIGALIVMWITSNSTYDFSADPANFDPILFPQEMQPNEPVTWSDNLQWPSCGKRKREPFGGYVPAKALLDKNSTTDEIMEYNSQGDDGIEPRIVDGMNAERGEYPWFVQLSRPNEGKFHAFCSASLLNSRWILTAAHCCITNLNPSDMIVTVGTLRPPADPKGRRVKVDQCIIHPYYNERYQLVSADIALIRMINELKPPPESTYLPYNSICLPKYDEFRRRSVFEIAGTGVTGAQNDASSILKKGLLEVKPQNCSSIGAKQPIGAFFCIQIQRPVNPGTCSGDSGSAIMWKSPKSGRVYQVGVATSVTLDQRRDIWCLLDDRVLFFLDVWHVSKWLNKTMVEEWGSSAPAQPGH